MRERLVKLMIFTGGTLILIGVIAGCTPQTIVPTTPPPQAGVPSPTAMPPAMHTPTEVPTAVMIEPSPELSGDPVRGGLLYDNWWGELQIDPPAGDHPMWALQSTNTRTGGDTWRCKECHGWDYKGAEGAYGSGSHMTGFKGIMGVSGHPAAELLAILKGSTNPDHDFSGLMSEQDLIDLALFMSETLIDVDALIAMDADAVAGEEKYEQVCTLCHGPSGTAINFGDLHEPEFVGHIAADNPWEFIHKVRYGQAGWPMPSAIRNGWSEQDVANVMGYAQGLPIEPAVSAGGLMYDKWWVVLGIEVPSGDHPLWATQTTNTRTGEDTWRCKECHGWDYKGVEGAYGSGSHMTGFKGILGAATLSSEELTGWLTGQMNPDHDFSAYMDDVAIEALVEFIQTEMVDTASIIAADGSVSGQPEAGKPLYENTCAECHGEDGKKLNFGEADEPEYIGTIALDNPWEFFHKASFGQPGEPMPAGLALGFSMEDLANLISFAKTLPPE